MKRVVLDTQRRRTLRADSITEDGDHYVLVLHGRTTLIPVEKVAYIQDLDDEPDPRGRGTIEPQRQPDPQPPPLPVASSPVATPPPLAPAFAAAVQEKLRSAPPPEPHDDEPDASKDFQVIVELSGSAAGSYSVYTDEANFVAEHVREGLVSDIFANAELKDNLKTHNVVGITKSGNLVTLECRSKPPIHAQSPSAAVASLVNNIVGLVSPTTKLPDLPIQGLKVEDSKK
jgi:hypothetical protein